MRLLDRYLLRELFAMLGLCLCGLLLVYIAFDLISELNKFQEAHLQVADVVQLYLVKIPDILVFILPVTLLTSLLYVVTNHARHHELTAMRAAGMSLGRICAPYFAVGLLLSLVVFALNEYCVPESEARQFQIMHRRIDPPAAGGAVQQKFGFRNRKDLRNWVVEYDPDTGVISNPHVDWEENGKSWRLEAKRAESINGVWTFFGPTAFTTNDFANLETLADKLKHPTVGDGLSSYLATNLSPTTRKLLENYSGGASADLQKSLIEDFNRIIRRGPLYDFERFASVKLSPGTASLAKRKLDGAELIELNRVLLVEAYPEFSRNSLYAVKVWMGEIDSKPPERPFIATNILAMQKFSESPGTFASEARSAIKLDSLKADSTEFPIREIREYMRLHPDLPLKDRAWLQTQLQGRFAMPWSCLVAVLIAIPFGAPSGRRNVFVGVASAIVICFVYFILLRLGLALGTGGVLPPVVAAWLPNAFFGISGVWLLLRVR